MQFLIKIALPISWLLSVVGFFIRVQTGGENRWLFRFSLIAVALFYAIRYWNKKQMHCTDTIKCILIVFWCGLEVSFGTMIKFERIVFYAFFLLGVIWLFLEIIDLIKREFGISTLSDRFRVVSFEFLTGRITGYPEEQK